MSLKPNPFLNIDPEPEPTREPHVRRQPRNGIDPSVFLVNIEEMLDSGKFDWAEDTLSGIQETVDRAGYVTQNQADAVRNIAEKRRWEVSF